MPAYDYITSTGVIVPDFATTLAEVQAEFRTIDGWADIDLSPETPQGALAVAEALRRDGIARNNAQLANQINPDIATGVFLDGLMALMGSKRIAATYSIIYGVQLTGRPSTIVPAGSIATDGQNEWRSLQTVVIPPSGVISADFQATETGAIACPAHGLNTIAQSVLGWETVDNPNPAILGRSVESDVKARRRRADTLALYGAESVEAIISALYDLPDVRSVSFWENYTSSTIVKDGISLVPHSMYLCIDGGDGDEIARTLKRVRGIGSGYNGSQTVTITDEITGQSYAVKFDRPTTIPLAVKVTVKQTLVDSQSIVPKLVQNWADGETLADVGCVVGRDVSPFEMAAAINEQEPGVYIRKIELSDDGGTTWSTAIYPVLINELAVIQAASVTVVIA